MPHFYSLSFIDQQGEVTKQSNTYVGLSEPKVTREVIAGGRQAANVGPRAVLLSVSYLGEMTAQEWNDSDA